MFILVQNISRTALQNETKSTFTYSIEFVTSTNLIYIYNKYSTNYIIIIFNSDFGIERDFSQHPFAFQLQNPVHNRCIAYAGEVKQI